MLHPCFKGGVQCFCKIGGLSQGSIFMVINIVLPMSEESFKNTSGILDMILCIFAHDGH